MSTKAPRQSERVSIPTEKKRLYELDEALKRLQTLSRKTFQKISTLDTMLQSDGNSKIINDQEAELQKMFSNFSGLSITCKALMTEDDEKDKVDKQLEKVKESVLAHQQRYHDLLQATTSVKTKSHKSSKTGTSNRSSKILEKKAKLVELQLQQKYLEEKQRQDKEMQIKEDQLKQKQKELQEGEMSIKRMKEESENLKIKFEVEKTQAALKVLQEEDYAVLEELDVDLAALQCPQTDYTAKYVSEIQPSNIKPAVNEQQSHSQVNPSISEEILTLIIRSKAPQTELEVFSGSSIEYPYFMATFKQVVEENIHNERERLILLIKYTKDDAKELIKSCVYLDDNICYTRAKELLERKFGSSFKIAAEYRKQLLDWPRVKSSDAASLNKFETFLLKYQSSMAKIGRASDNSPELLQLLQSKLPNYLQDRWNRTAYKVRSKHQREPGIKDFVDLVSKETVLLDDPLYSREAISNLSKDNNSRPERQKFKSNTITLGKCICCNQSSHDLEKCEQYIKMELADRKRFVFRKRLCFCCLKPTDRSHSAKNCRSKRTCSICKRSHPTTLHEYRVNTQSTSTTTPTTVSTVTTTSSQPTLPAPTSSTPVQATPLSSNQTTEPIVSGCITNTSKSVSLSIVKVKICHPSNPSKFVETFALLDNGSQGTFITEDVLHKLGVNGTETTIEIETMAGTHQEKTSFINKLQVSKVDQCKGSKIKLPKCYTRLSLPADDNDIATPERIQNWTYLSRIKHHLPEISEKVVVGLLIGTDCPKALEPIEVIQSEGEGPYAYKTRLGWCVSGPMANGRTNSFTCNRINITVKETIKDLSLRDMVIAAQSIDFHESKDEQSISMEDKRFVQMMEEETTFKDGHYTLPLPFRSKEKIIPNNRDQVLHRTNWLKQKLSKQPQMYDDYVEFMDDIINKGYASKATKPPEDGKTWYIPHHGVYHPKKPDKIRVVFDCSMKANGYCLNQELLQGPDLTNQLMGVLLRFREEPIAVMGDIEAMFCQVRVPEDQRDCLRFLWWQDGNLESELQEYQMNVHYFGITSSPSCVNYALRRTATETKAKYGDEAAEVLHRNFYVDDMLKSLATERCAISTVSNTRSMCQEGGFRLTKFHSNSRAVIESIPTAERSKSLKDVDIANDSIPNERALGMQWSPERDVFIFKVKFKEKPSTRRGVLSTVSSMYDPLGLISPFLLEGKKLLQEICANKHGWDEPLTELQLHRFEKWKSQLKPLEQFEIQRCLKPKDFGAVVNVSLHHFSDGAEEGYGQVSYVRYLNDKGDIHCQLVLSKSRVAPLKRPTIPRLELSAAVVSVKVSLFLKRELDTKIDDEFFWTDAQVVLSYISNDSKRFHIFVANRSQFVREKTRLDQWRYVPSKHNPADHTSKGLSLSATEKIQHWFRGPDFLYQSSDKWPNQPNILKLSNDDKEVRKIKVQSAKIMSTQLIDVLESQTKSWTKMIRIVHRILCWSKSNQQKSEVEVRQRAEKAIIRLVQQKAFPYDINQLKKNKPLNKSSSIYQLSPFIDEEDILRVGGRIKNANIPYEMKHPIVLPKQSTTTMSVIRKAHEEMQHGGRNTTLCRLREKGFWCINGNSLVRNILHKCVRCRILRGKTETPKMADLPEDRLQNAPPFTYVGLDLFGPFLIKERRSELKRYGIIYTCLNSRACHLESVNSMDTDSFIMCLRRFIARRGPVRLVRCDNGSNFVGARNELMKAINELDDEAIKTYLVEQNADFISWKFNPPYASNFGGAWERLIRSTRGILDSLLSTHGHSLNDESFRTLLVEIEAVLNSRPLTVECLSDAESPTPLTPNHLLTMKSNIVMPPPGRFEKTDVYSRKRWRRVQHICNEFWSRWRKEYVQHLQTRQKCNDNRRNLQIGDVVLVKEDTKRNEWKLAVVDKVRHSDDGIVRTVEIRQGSLKYVRPVNKLILILENGNGN